MPLNRFVLLIVGVIAAAGATIWLSVFIANSVDLPFGWLLLTPVLLVGYVIFRVISERVGNAKDDHCDRVDH